MTDMPEIGKTRTAAGECLSGDAVGRAWSGAGYLVVEAVYLRTEEFCLTSPPLSWVCLGFLGQEFDAGRSVAALFL